MDNDRLVKMARASCMVLSREDDGTYTLLPTTKRFADMVESAVAHQYEENRKKSVLTIKTLQSKVSAQASEILRLRAMVSNAVNCLEEVGDE